MTKKFIADAELSFTVTIPIKTHKNTSEKKMLKALKNQLADFSNGELWSSQTDSPIIGKIKVEPDETQKIL